MGEKASSRLPAVRWSQVRKETDRLPDRHAALLDLFKEVGNTADQEAYEVHLADSVRRSARMEHFCSDRVMKKPRRAKATSLREGIADWFTERAYVASVHRRRPSRADNAT